MIEVRKGVGLGHISGKTGLWSVRENFVTESARSSFESSSSLLHQLQIIKSYIVNESQAHDRQRLVLDPLMLCHAQAI